MYLSMLIIGTKSHELIISQHNNDGAHSHKPPGFVAAPFFCCCITSLSAIFEYPHLARMAVDFL